MSEKKITVTASDLPTSYVPYTNDDVNAIYFPTSVAAKCSLCDNDFPVSALSTNFVTICPYSCLVKHCCFLYHKKGHPPKGNGLTDENWDRHRGFALL